MAAAIATARRGCGRGRRARGRLRGAFLITGWGVFPFIIRLIKTRAFKNHA